MSLTKEALYEREWGAVPELAKLLNRKQLSPEWTGYTSASDNFVARVDRLLTLFALIQENEQEVHDAILRVGGPLRTEMTELSQELRWISERFAEASKFTSDMANRR